MIICIFSFSSPLLDVWSREIALYQSCSCLLQTPLPKYTHSIRFIFLAEFQYSYKWLTAKRFHVRRICQCLAHDFPEPYIIINNSSNKYFQRLLGKWRFLNKYLGKQLLSKGQSDTDFYQPNKVSQRRIWAPNLLAIRANTLLTRLFGSTLELGILILVVREPVTIIFNPFSSQGRLDFFNV